MKVKISYVLIAGLWLFINIPMSGQVQKLPCGCEIRKSIFTPPSKPLSYQEIIGNRFERSKQLTYQTTSPKLEVKAYKHESKFDNSSEIDRGLNQIKVRKRRKRKLLRRRSKKRKSKKYNGQCPS